MKAIVGFLILLTSGFAQADIGKCPMPDSLEEYDMVISDGNQFLSGEQLSNCLKKIMQASREQAEGRLTNTSDRELVRMLMGAAYKAELESQ